MQQHSTPNNTPTSLQQFTASKAGPGIVPDTANGDTPEASTGEIVTSSDLLRQFGAYGNNIFQGFITGEDYLSEFNGRAAIAVLDEMRKSDATVKASLKLIMDPLMGADWDIEPASDDTEDKIVAEFVRYNLFELIKWRHFLQELLTCLPFGYSVFEKAFTWREWEGVDGKGVGEYRCLDGVYSRKQDTIMAWQQSDGTPGVSQMTPSGGSFNIPAAKLLVFTHEREGNNFAGVSVLRSAYKHWYIKNGLEKTMAIAAERQGVGVPFYEAPESASQEDLTKADSAMKNLRTNEQAFLRMPVGWTYGFIDMKANGNYDPMPQIHYHNRQILLNVLGQHLDMGSSGASGSRSTSEDHGKILAQSLEAIAATVIEDEINENLIKQLVDLNFTVNKYPRLTHKALSDDNVEKLPDALQKLVSAQLLTPDADTEASLRETFKLPEMPDATREAYDLKQQNGTALLKNGGVIPAADPTKKPATPGTAAATPAAPATKTEAQLVDDAAAEDDIQADDALAQARKAHLQLIKAAEKLYAEPTED